MKSTRIRTHWNIALLPVLLVTAGFGASRLYSQTPSASETNSSDAQFVANASSGGKAEVKLGELAEQRASNSQVKNFGQKMATDHSEANKKLQAAAAKSGMSVASHLNQKDQATYAKLSGLSGTAFDQAYAADMVRDHEKDISEFEKEAKNGKDSAIRQFALETLPVLRQHLQLAQEMARTVGSSTGM